MIEYLNGPVTSEWGRRRAENGHPEPYGVKYIGIGNEEVLFNGDRADEYDHYVERFNLLHDAIKGKDPSVKLISTAWWRADSPSMERTFRALDGKARLLGLPPRGPTSSPAAGRSRPNCAVCASCSSGGTPPPR